MTLTKTQKLEKLDQLETKVGEAIDRIKELTARCESLSEENVRLERELSDMRDRNDALSEEVVELKSASAETGEEKEILIRIDRMLEKFGELHI